MTTTTTTATSGPSLQVLSEAAASSWLLQWSGLVGLVAARTVSPPHQHAPQLKRDVPSRPVHILRGASRTQGYDAAVPRHRVGQEGRSSPRCGRTGVTLKYEEEPAKRITSATVTTHTSLPGARTYCEGQTAAISRGCGVGVSGESVTRCVPSTMNVTTVEANTRQCCSYLTSHLPPLLLQRVLDTAWRTLSAEVTLGGRESSVADHQVREWSHRAPILLGVATCLPTFKYTLDLTGLPHHTLPHTLPYVEKHFPVERLSALIVSKGKARRGSEGCLLDASVMSRLLHRTTLASLTLSLDLVSGCLLQDISQLSLQELQVCGGRHNETQVLQDLCGLPCTSLDQVVEAVKEGHLQAFPVTPLRESLRKLTISLPGVPSAMYQVFLAVFHRLQHYNPPSGAAPCISAYARMTGQSGAPRPLSLVSLSLGRTSRHDIQQVGRMCPALRDVSLSVELDCENTLSALQTCDGLSGVQVSYYPASVSAPPKVEASVLLPLLDVFGSQLLSLGLTGFSLGSRVVGALAALPELRRLTLSDCWLSRPEAMPCHPFPSLDTLALTFLPPLDTLQVLTAGSCLQCLDIQVVASEAPGNTLTDTNVRHLVTCGAITSIHTFTSSSPFLTLASLRHLATLPRLRNVGTLARWGLTQEEVRCVGHSGPPHLLCHS